MRLSVARQSLLAAMRGVNLRCGGFQAVDRAAVHIDADVRFPLPGSGFPKNHERRAKIPVVALLRRGHLGVTCLGPVLC